MNFSPSSRVWIYLSSREFAASEVSELNELIKKFCVQWAAHGKNLHAHGEVLHQRFIMLMVDESKAGASGCSIDTSVHFIQKIERDYNTQLFNRTLVAFKKEEQVRVINASEAKEMLSEERINDQTPVFNTLVQNKEEFDRNFVIPLRESWLVRYLQSANNHH
jgi:hypothetical protein